MATLLIFCLFNLSILQFLKDVPTRGCVVVAVAAAVAVVAVVGGLSEDGGLGHFAKREY